MEEPIIVSFNNLDGLARRPLAHTCKGVVNRGARGALAPLAQLLTSFSGVDADF
jgi:hypothetical protein